MPSPSYVAYRVAAAVANAVPHQVGQPLAEVTGRMLAPLLGERRRIVKRNLRRATDGALDGFALERAVSDTFASYGRYWLELFRLPTDARGSVESRGDVGRLRAHQRRTRARPGRHPRPAAPRWIRLRRRVARGRGLAPTVVVESVEPPQLFEWFAGVRRAIGMEVIPLGAQAASGVLRALKGNRVVCLLSDRDIAGDGMTVQFFGEETTLPGGPATLALRSGAVLLPTAVYFRPHGRHFVRVGCPDPHGTEGPAARGCRRVTQELAHRFEEYVRMAPEQWHVMQPNWPSDHER